MIQKDESMKRELGNRILSELQQLSSSDEIKSSLLCLYDLYLPSLMEGFALRNVMFYPLRFFDNLSNLKSTF